jgi:hypothetical protein
MTVDKSGVKNSINMIYLNSDISWEELHRALAQKGLEEYTMNSAYYALSGLRNI